MAYDQPSMKPLMKSEMPVFTKNSAVKKFKKKNSRSKVFIKLF